MKMKQLIEYMNIHLISLHQDADELQDKLDNFEGDLDSDSYRELEVADIVNTGEIIATQHLLSVARDMIE
jgi:hypothetical protein